MEEKYFLEEHAHGGAKIRTVPQPQDGRNLQSLRKLAGYKSAAAFAEAIGMPTSTYTHYEQTEGSIPLRAAWEIADALNCTIDEMIGRMPPREPEKAHPVQDRYDDLQHEEREFIDELFDFARFRASRRKSKEAEELRAIYRDECLEMTSAYRNETGVDVWSSAKTEEPEIRESFRTYVESDRRAERDRTCELLSSAHENWRTKQPLSEEEQRIHRRYQDMFVKTKKEFNARLDALRAKWDEADGKRLEEIMKAYDNERSREAEQAEG